MLEALLMVVLKTVIETCVKYYVGQMLESGQLSYNKADLGYDVPKWYMNIDAKAQDFYAYGTAVDADEFVALEAARKSAAQQMTDTLKICHEKMSAGIHYDTNSLPQRRLIENFAHGEGVDAIVRQNARVDRNQLVKMPDKERRMRAFVRLKMDAATYQEIQKKRLTELTNKLIHQKTDDIMAEMDAEIAKQKGPPGQAAPQAPPAEAPATQ